MEINQNILKFRQECIPYEEFLQLCREIEQKYYFSNYKFWMWKIFQLGFVFGKRAERDKRKKANVSKTTQTEKRCAKTKRIERKRADERLQEKEIGA